MERAFTKKVKEEIDRHLDKHEKINLGAASFNKVIVKKDLRQKFLKHGHIYNPEYGHHLEYNFNNLDIANITIKELSLYGISGKLSITNKKRYIVYIADAKTIMEYLRILGATKVYLEYKKITDYKQKIKNTNRQVNFEISNIKKSTSASLEQIEVINKLLKYRKINTLDENTRNLIYARKKYPTYTLTELAEKLSISKSALNHRFIKIRNILKEYES